jgi:adenylate cyclase
MPWRASVLQIKAEDGGMNGSAKQTELQQRAIAPLLMAAVVLGLLGLPAAVWLDLRELSERMLRTQAREISRIIDDMRGFYGTDVVARVLQANGPVSATHNYRDVQGAIPIPATLSIELGMECAPSAGQADH